LQSKEKKKFEKKKKGEADRRPHTRHLEKKKDVTIPEKHMKKKKKATFPVQQKKNQTPPASLLKKGRTGKKEKTTNNGG